jgi:adenine deaminase
MRFAITRNLVDVHQRTIYPAKVSVVDGIVLQIERVQSAERFLMPGFVDAHIHIESSMLLPAEFARIAVTHGTVATVSDPHEIANVCGVAGIELMLRSAAKTIFKFMFGAPACVPATRFETAGACLDAPTVARLLDDPRIGYLSEVMDFPAVLSRSSEIMAKIKAAKKRGKPVDGHAPGLRGEQAARYFSAGITTDHECCTLEEALDKLRCGCLIAIREGSAARNFDALEILIDEFPESCMLCSDDKHPDELLLGHLNQLAARAIASGRDLMNVIRVACVNPVRHYGLDVGLLRPGDPADFIVVDNLVDFPVAETYINGQRVAKDGECLMPPVAPETLNVFDASQVSEQQFKIIPSGSKIRVIEAMDGQLTTGNLERDIRTENGDAVCDLENDLLKIAVVNRYRTEAPSIAFVTGFGLHSGAFASSVAHDSHNVVAVGTSDSDLAAAVNAVIRVRGGLAVSANGQTDILKLPVAGLMSTESCQLVGQRYAELDRRLRELGSTLRAPFMTLSFMALLVIPSLKLSDRGLFDADRFEFVPLIVDDTEARIS